MQAMRQFVLGVMLWVWCLPAMAGNITITRAIVVAPPTANAASAAAYFTIENKGATADVLTGIATPTAAQAMLHENTEENGVMKMNMLDRLEIQPGQTIIMAPAKLHVMLMGMAKPFRKGGEVAFELTFSAAGKLAVTAKVVALSEALQQ